MAALSWLLWAFHLACLAPGLLAAPAPAAAALPAGFAADARFGTAGASPKRPSELPSGARAAAMSKALRLLWNTCEVHVHMGMRLSCAPRLCLGACMAACPRQADTCDGHVPA